MKKLVILLLIISLVFSFSGCKKAEDSHIVVGSVTTPSGDVSGFWNNNATDTGVKELVMGASTVALDQNGEYLIDTNAMKEHSITENADGSKTAVFKINDALTWSNGEKITAKDYVFTCLFFSGKFAVETLGAVNANAGFYFDGYSEYANGDTNVFSGVRLIDESSFSVTIDKDNLPYYYETYLYTVLPTYMKGWSGCLIDIADDGNGCYFVGELNDKVAQAANEYRFSQSAFSGAYSIESFDTANAAYTLKRNEKYIGNFEGQKPVIEKVTVKEVRAETMLDELRTGSVDIIVRMSDGAIITEGLTSVKGNEFKAASYDNAGYAYIMFNCSVGAASSTAVRQALAHLLDREQLTRDYTLGSGKVVNALYGMGMNEYAERKDELDKLNSYPYDPEKAKELLISDGWIYDKNGSEYKDGIRYKNIDGELTPLVINWASVQGNALAELISVHLVNNPDLIKCGIKIEETPMTFSQMYSAHFMNPDEDHFNMYSLSMPRFTPLFDESGFWELGSDQNASHLDNEELEYLSKAMVLVDGSDKEGYLDLFVSFNEKINELLPCLPLYSTTYTDFYSNRLKNYDGITTYWGWYSQLPYAQIGE
ncbi:MAG: ABC transporter substrate-binding protein [Clostridiales bacterium]|nr:ABC transporter substrate-binding protein [Clostridiales bacterium]